MAFRYKRTGRDAGDYQDGQHIMMKTGWSYGDDSNFYTIPFSWLGEYVMRKNCYHNSNTMLALIAREGDFLPRERALEYERHKKPYKIVKPLRIDEEPQVRIGYSKGLHSKDFRVAGKFVDSYALPKAFFRICRPDNAKIPNNFIDEMLKISVTLLRLLTSTSYSQLKYNGYIDNMTYNEIFEKECKADFLHHPLVMPNSYLPENEKIIDLNDIVKTAPKYMSEIKKNRIINAPPLNLIYYEDHNTYAHLGLIMLTLSMRGSIQRNNCEVTLNNNFCLDKGVLNIQGKEPLPNLFFREMVMCFLDCAEILQYGEIKRELEGSKN